jgi:hypothetical protein
MRRFTALSGALLLALSLAAFTGTALAGNGNGNGNGAAAQPQAPATPAAAPGNSGSAPGQAKKAAPAAAPAPAPAAPAPAKSNPGQAKKAAAQQAQASTPTTNNNSTGVKPSNATTAHKNTWAPASSNKTKQYGNGKTAGQIATQAGYGNATLYGPGNSQPHKVLCGGHYVDVHALKAKGSKCGTPAAQTQAPAAQTPTLTPQCGQPVVTTAGGVLHKTGSNTNPFVLIHPSAHSAHVTGKHTDDVIMPATQTLVPNGQVCNQGRLVPSTPTATGTAAGTSGGTAGSTAGTTAGTSVTGSTAATRPAGGVLGAQATIRSAAPAHRAAAKPAGGVLGAVATIGSTAVHGTLPFTGLPLWIAVAIAAVLLAVGLALWRRGRAPTAV